MYWTILHSNSNTLDPTTGNKRSSHTKIAGNGEAGLTAF